MTLPAQPPTPSGPRRFATVAVPFALLALAALFGLPLCPSALVLRTPCPGCGLTRAALALLRGDFAGAYALQPAAFVVVPLLGLSLGWVAVHYVATGRSSPPRWALGAVIASFVTLSLVWAARLFGAFGGPVPI